MQPCAWVTVNGRPAIIMTADRVGPVVGATVKVAVPGPVVVAPPAVTVIQSTLLVADHEQPAAVPRDDPVWLKTLLFKHVDR